MVLCQAVCQKPRAVRGIGKWIRACAFKCFFLGEKEDFVLSKARRYRQGRS